MEEEKSSYGMNVLLVILILAATVVSYHNLSGGNFRSVSVALSEAEKIPLVSAANGGKVVAPDGAVIIVPPGALASDARLSITRVSEGDVMSLYKLEPEGLAFKKPVTVEMPYNAKKLPAGTGPYDLQVRYWLKREMPNRQLNSKVDTMRKVVSTELMAF